MSHTYQAVGWNRQKLRYDAVVWAFCALYLLVYVLCTVLTDPDYTFETVLLRSTSTLALLLLHFILSIGPLTRINSKFLPLLYNRRHLGVTMFLVAAVHGIFALIQFHSLGNVSPLESLFTSNTRYNSFVQFPFQSLGFFALLILLLMAVTSHDFWLHNLGPRVWKGLHMTVYLAYFLIIMHVMLGVIQFETSPVLTIMIGAGAVFLTALHLRAGWLARQQDALITTSANDGFVRVCVVSEIVPDHAKMFCIGKESIAVFSTNGKLFAVNNVCKHQHGPLAEGRILDGCITCPWHGYQYLPQNGQSPPPFTEKISTYDVKIIGGAVWINPSPYPEGTGRPGAVISL